MATPIRQLFALEKKELQVVLLSASYFFLLLCAYYILRPIRETVAIARTADDLPLLFLGTMVTMLLLAPVIGALVSKYKRSQFIPMTYHFISVNLLLFFLAFKFVPTELLFYVGVVFYLWLSVINLLLISLFWGFMSDGIAFKQSKRLFPSIAIGGTLGAIFGSSLTQQSIELVGLANLFLVSLVLFEAAVWVMKKIDRLFNLQADTSQIRLAEASPASGQPKKPLSVRLTEWSDGVRYTLKSPYLLGIAGYIFFYGLTSTFLYFQQGQLVASASDNTAERTQIFASIDIWSNALTLLFQLFISRQLLTKFGIGVILMGLPLLTLGGFIALSITPTLSVLIIFQALRRSLNYGLFKPAREILFTVLPQEQKYKAKSFVDTFVYRGGDAFGAFSQKLLTIFHLGIASIALAVVPIALAWSLIALYLGAQASKSDSDSHQTLQSSKSD